MVRKLGIGCGVLVLLLIGLAVIGGSQAPKTTVTPAGTSGAAVATGLAAPQAKVGDKVTSGNWEYTVTKVERTKTLTWSDFGNKTDALGTWLVVSMTLKNIGNANFPLRRGRAGGITRRSIAGRMR